MLIDCPNCGRKMYLSSRFDDSECFKCHHIVTDPTHFLPTRQHKPEAHFQAYQALRRARQQRHNGNRRGEIRALQQAVRYDPRQLHAHIRLGRILPDKRERRRHLMIARRIDPNNMDAITLLAEMQARMSPEEAAKLFGDDAPVKAVEQVKTQAVELQCPVCRAALKNNPEMGFLECGFCGYSEKWEEAFITQNTVREKLVETISGTQWEVGERVMTCSACSAQWAHESQLSTQCPYCNSAQIVISDEVGSFQPPHGVIPFEVTEQQALQAINERLLSFGERMKGLLDPNTIKQAVLTAVYLPFWVFDEAIDIQMQTEFDVVGFKSAHVDPRKARQQGTMYDLGIPAVKTVPSQLTQQLGSYFRHSMVAYQPGVLDHPAEIYEVALNKAILRARTLLARAITSEVAMRYKLIMATDFSHTSFQLIMAPVWLATLHEVDGEIRPALVNGQIGKVVLGQSHRP